MPRLLHLVAAAAAFVVACLCPLRAQEEGALHPKLEPLRPLLGRTWRGEIREPSAAKPVEDIARWERALNGQFVRVLHSIGAGAYGGETLIFWDPERQVLAYHYYTTAGFRTAGTMSVDGNTITSTEAVTGDSSGVTEVRATMELRPDGTFVTSAHYQRRGSWEPGHSGTYREDPTAQVVFK